MLHKMRIVGIIVCAASLAACVSNNPAGYTDYQSYSYEGRDIYSENYDYRANYQGNYQRYYDYQQETKKEVVVPETYHVGAYHSPTSHKDRDRQWVQSQNPQGYTIELADGDKASQVAGKLHKAPKSDRQAAIKYQRGGQVHYKGVYGTYNSYDAAQQALNALPADVKEGANIKPWGSVQRTVNE